MLITVARHSLLLHLQHLGIKVQLADLNFDELMISWDSPFAVLCLLLSVVLLPVPRACSRLPKLIIQE